MHDSLSQEPRGSEADDDSTSRQDGGVMTDEQDEGLDRLTDLLVTWGFDLHAFLRKRLQETPATGDAGDGTAETMDTSQRGVVDASPVPAGRAETVETMDSSQGGAVNASSVPAGRTDMSRRRIRLKAARWTTLRSRQGVRNSRDDGFISSGRGRRLLGPGREGRNSRDD